MLALQDGDYEMWDARPEVPRAETRGYVANEKKLLAIVALDDVDAALQALRSHSLGNNAAVIGEVVDEHTGFLMMKTRVGGTRIVDMSLR